MMNEERKMILQMVKDGTVSIDEAQRLLEALPADEPREDSATNLPRVRGNLAFPKRLVVHVTEGGKAKVNVKIPFSLVRAGLKLGQSFTSLAGKYAGSSPEEARAYEMLKNIDIDELLASINDGAITLPYTMVEVNDEEQDTHVLIALE